MAINTSPIAQQSEVVKMVLYAYQADGSLAPATIGGGGGGSGTVTSVATSSPITGGPISTTGTIGCPTCTTNAAALTANALVIGGGLQAASALGSLGTTTTVLHGNAAGAPTFGAVNLAADVSGQLPISAVGSSGLSGSSPITISAAGAIACATCNTSASAITSNVVPKGSGGAQGLANSSITDNGTTVSTTELFTALAINSTPIGSTTASTGAFTTLGATGIVSLSQAGALSASAVNITGAPVTGGSGTTTFPLVYINSGSAPTTFSTSGTLIGLNGPSGFAGNFIDAHVNGAGSVFSVTSAGAVVAASTVAAGAASNISWFGRSNMSSPSDGVILFRNNAQNAFTRLDLGGTTSSFPALQVNGAALQVELADGSAQAALSALSYSANGTAGVSVGPFTAITSITTVGGIVTALSGSSDAKLKTNVEPFNRGLADIVKINPVTYQWNEEGQKITNFGPDVRQAGFIAQDVQNAIPEAVGVEVQNGVEYLNFSDRPILAALVNAIKEQQEQIESLKRKIA